MSDSTPSDDAAQPDWSRQRQQAIDEMRAVLAESYAGAPLVSVQDASRLRIAVSAAPA